MKLIRNLFLSLLCFGSLANLPLASAAPEPTPSPTPHEEPSPTPHPEPSGTPSGEPGDDNGGDDSGDDGEHGDLSLHGFYEGTMSSGALLVFYIESNTHVQINVLDVVGQQIGFAEGALSNGSFAFNLTNDQVTAKRPRM